MYGGTSPIQCSDCSAQFNLGSYEDNHCAAFDAGWRAIAPHTVICARCGRFRDYDYLLRREENAKRAVEAARAERAARFAKRTKARKAQRKARKAT